MSDKKQKDLLTRTVEKTVEVPTQAIGKAVLATHVAGEKLAALPNTAVRTTIALGDILFRKDKRTELFLQEPQERRLEVIRRVTPTVRRDILMHIPESDLISLLEAVDPDEATDILQLLTRHKREKVLQLVSSEVKDSLSTLLEFDPDTAAGLMTLDYIQVQTTDSIASVASQFKRHESRTGRPPVILVMNGPKLAGFMPGHQLGFGRPTELIDKYVKHIGTISYAADHERVVRQFNAHPHSKVAVLNDGGDVLGIIYSDDVLKLIQEREASSLYDFAGISQEESVTDSAKRKAQNRYRWLIINLGTSFLAAFTVSMFEDTLAKYVLLAIYMPIVAGMGGNAATQTLAVLVRGIALKQITLKTAWKPLRNEMGAGLINGLINGVLVAAIVILVNHDVKVATVLGLAMVINLQVAAFFGTLVPLIMSKLGKDPASSATIFITTATDVLGFLAFLGLASALLA
ncbi:MAG TPA: magnesium transporter [Candidatus Saccharimonadales bacterium]|nr:magnesium transporter [Candidatus Saccharimonadales bacterium]